jgi:hypothetical protein
MIAGTLLSRTALTTLCWSTSLACVVAADADPATLQCRQTDTAIQISRGGQLVLQYNLAPRPAPDAARTQYERSGYIHPLYSPDGKLVTGDFAADHPHQHGLFVAWTNTSFQGKPVDFWNQAKKIGVVLHDRVISVDPGQDSAVGFEVGLTHYALDPDGRRTAILDDVWTVRLEEARDETGAPIYRIDFTTEQTNVTEHPLTINQYHYGGVGFRGNNRWYSQASAEALQRAAAAPQWQAPPLPVTRHRFVTSEGSNRREGNHSRPAWTALYGLVGDGNVAGVRVSGDPRNFRHPHPVRLHPNKPYFALSPCVLGAFDVLPGQTYRARYRFEVFDGAPEPASR